MIKTVSNQPYECYDKNNVYKKEIKINKELPSLISQKQTSQMKGVFETEMFQYVKQEQGLAPKKNEWDQFVEMLTCEEEKCGKALANGYPLEDQTINQITYMQHEVMQDKSPARNNTPNIQEKISRVQEGRDDMYYYGVQHQGTITLNDLYKWSFSGSGAKKTIGYSHSQIKGVLEMNGLEPNAGNKQAVEKLLSLGLEVTPAYVTKIQNLETTVQGLDAYETAQKELEEDTPLLKEEKILYTEKDIHEIVEDLTDVDDTTIESLLEEGKEVTIGNLREVLHKNTQKALGKEEQGQDLEDGVREQVISTDIKEQIKEVRAKLSVEAAQKLSEKLPLESTELSRVAKELTAIVEEVAVEGLQAAAVEVTVENKSQMIQTLDAVVTMGRQKSFAIKTQSEDLEISLGQIHEATMAYEEQALEPEQRFGENIERIEGQIEAFLETNDIEITDEVVEAAKALIMQELPLTQENLETMKPIVMQMNTFLEEMTPLRIASFIKEGMNPYEASVGHLMEWIAVERLPQLKESLGEAILALETQGKINADQKQSLLGMYRILNGVESHKFEVAGYLYKNQLPLTIERLEEAVRYSQKGEHVTAQIDDHFGALEEVKYSRKTARLMLEESRQSQEQVISYIKLLETMEIPFESEEMIHDYAKLSQKIYPFIKQQLKAHLVGFNGMDMLPDSFKEKIEVAKKVDYEVLESLEKYQIPVTLNHVYWMQRLLDEPDLYQKFLDKQKEGKEAFPKDFEEIEDTISEVLSEAAAGKSEAMLVGDFLGYKQHKQFEELIGLQKQLMEKEGLYQIPFVIEGERRMVQLYIKENAHKKAKEENSLKVAISYDTKTLGQVNAYLEIRDKGMKYEIFGQNRDATLQLKQQDGKLRALLEQIGYVLLEGGYTQDAKTATVTNPMPLRGESEFEVIV